MRVSRLLTLLLLLNVFAVEAPLQAWSLVAVDDFAFDTYKIKRKRDPYFPETTDWTWGAALHWDVELLGFLKWENINRMDCDTYQVRHVSWEFEVVAPLFGPLELFGYHMSRHVMEQDRDINYPIEERYGVRLHFLEGRRKSSSSSSSSSSNQSSR